MRPDVVLSGGDILHATPEYSLNIVEYHTPTMKIINLAAYKFIHLTELLTLQKTLKEECLSIGIKGTILISEEGINFCVAGTPDAVTRFKALLATDVRLADIVFKESLSDFIPYKRMLVKIRQEIIPLSGIDPTLQPAPVITAPELKQWIDEGKDFVLLDTRNNYEVEFGTFKNAMTFDIRHFRTFARFVEQLPDELKEKPIVSFCTGGVRCEKAAPLLLQQGFKEVYQLDGGILAYFEQCGGAHYQGDCYVFDQRIAVNPQLEPARVAQCFLCSFPIDRQDPPDPEAICLSCHENGPPTFL